MKNPLLHKNATPRPQWAPFESDTAASAEYAKHEVPMLTQPTGDDQPRIAANPQDSFGTVHDKSKWKVTWTAKAKAASAAYKSLAMKYAADVVKTAAISVSQAQDAEGPYMAIKMNGTEYEIRGEDAEQFRREYAAIPKPENKVNALVEKYLDKMQPAAIQYGVPPQAERYGKPEAPAPSIETPAPAKSEGKPSGWRSWLLNKKKHPYIQTLGLDGAPVPEAPNAENERGIDRHFREEQKKDKKPVPAPEAEAPVEEEEERRVPVGARRSSLNVPEVIKAHGLADKWQQEITAGTLAKVGSRYATRNDADSLTRRMARLVNKPNPGIE